MCVCVCAIEGKRERERERRRQREGLKERVSEREGKRQYIIWFEDISFSPKIMSDENWGKRHLGEKTFFISVSFD